MSFFRICGFRVRRFLALKPFLFNIFYSLSKHYRNELLVNAKTDIVIEGYPRSANTHAVVVTENTFDNINIAHHMHSEAQVLNAFKLNVPILVIIREPLDSVLSLAIRERFLSLSDCLNYYVDFYGFLNRNSKKIHILEFKDVISNSDLVTDKVANILNLDKENSFCSESSEYRDIINDLNVKDKGDDLKVSLPTQEKEDKKRELLKRLELEPTLMQLLEKANGLYNALRV
ncbi:hypothetical protein [Pseudoalteromonas shioyasakiensis]|uniref:hypothetical protein n=1 Tax=Pseudoalteromonas shioyasakiensis TaxID=1190813 RepID=UPI0007848413|nr:hypothetical protein [Pseudoalteromonas shioyasakiensis]